MLAPSRMSIRNGRKAMKPIRILTLTHLHSFKHGHVKWKPIFCKTIFIWGKKKKNVLKLQKTLLTYSLLFFFLLFVMRLILNEAALGVLKFIELNIEIKNRDANEGHKYCTSSATWEMESRPCRVQTGARQFPRLNGIRMTCWNGNGFKKTKEHFELGTKVTCLLNMLTCVYRGLEEESLRRGKEDEWRGRSELQPPDRIIEGIWQEHFNLCSGSQVSVRCQWNQRHLLCIFPPSLRQDSDALTACCCHFLDVSWWFSSSKESFLPFI